MNTSQICLDYIDEFERILNIRPGMLGSIVEISAKFFVIDNVKNLILFGEPLPHELTWYEFLIEKKLMRNLKSIPVEDNWDYERFVELRHQYLKWVDDRRAGNL
jgi:vacuolar-type H+-ATPase subunit C/Vma6